MGNYGWTALKDNRRIILFALAIIFAAFHPLFTGKNFLPFDHYPNWGQFAVKASGNEYMPDQLFLQETRYMPGCREWDPSGISILYPMQKLAADGFRKGTVPAWDPYVACGVPTFGGGQFRPFNPFQLPFYFHTTSNFYSLSIFLEILAGFFFMFLFLAGSGRSGFSSALGGLFFVMNPFVLNRLSFPDHLAAYFFLPLLLIAVEKLRGDGVKPLFLAALPFVIMGHVGHPELCFINSVVASLYFFIVVELPWKKKILNLQAVGVIVVLSLSIYIFPLLQEQLAGFSYKELGIPLWTPAKLLHLLTPTSDLFLLPVAAFLVAISLSAVRERKILFLFILMAAALFYASGIIPPGATVIMVPPFYAKFLFWFAVSVLAVEGADIFLKENRSAYYLAVPVVWTVLIVAALSFLPVALIDFFPRLYLLLALAFLPFFLLLFLYLKKFEGLRSTGAFKALLVVLAVLPYAFPLSGALIPWNTSDIRSYDAIEYVKKDGGSFRTASLFNSPFTALPCNNGSSLGARTIEFNGFLFPNSFYQNFGVESTYPTIVLFKTYRPDVLSRGGVKYVCSRSRAGGLNLKSSFDGKFVSVFEIPGAEGRLFLASKLIPVEGAMSKDDWRGLLKLHDSVVAVECPPYMAGTPAAPGKYDLRFLTDSYHKVAISARCGKGSFLVLRDTFNKGWKASVNGEESRIFRVDGCFRGVFIPPGDSRVEFVYRPRVLFLSAGLTVLMTLILLAGIFGVLPSRLYPPHRGDGQ